MGNVGNGTKLRFFLSGIGYRQCPLPALGVTIAVSVVSVVATRPIRPLQSFMSAGRAQPWTTVWSMVSGQPVSSYADLIRSNEVLEGVRYGFGSLRLIIPETVMAFSFPQGARRRGDRSALQLGRRSAPEPRDNRPVPITAMSHAAMPTARQPEHEVVRCRRPVTRDSWGAQSRAAPELRQTRRSRDLFERSRVQPLAAAEARQPGPQACPPRGAQWLR
jgi:hypothetical protein